MTDHDNRREPNPAVLLNQRSLVGLGLVALLVLLNQVVVQPPLLRLLTDAPLINVAGRQRMLSQRLAKAALAFDAATDDLERSRRREELANVLSLWSSTHETLHRDEIASGATGPAIAVFEEIEPSYRRMRDAARQLISSVDRATDRAGLIAILQAETAFLPGMERIVGIYESAARARVDRLIATAWGVTALVLMALVMIGRYILRPAAQVIDRQFAELRDARDVLEVRVLERTSDLERVNRELAHEVDERVQAEERQRTLVEQFSQVARTTTVGEMATGLAHELNQPLGAIANYTEGCLVALEGPAPLLDEVRAVLAKILVTTLRTGAIVQRIRRFVTRHGPARESFAPESLIRDVEEFFRDDSRRRGVTLRTLVAPELPFCWCDPVQIQQVLVNLVRNALDALENAQATGPTIVMTAKAVEKSGVEFTVSDNGEGIPVDRLPRIFDAYFSTRDEGMGMGLAISRTIVEAHQGRLEVESRPGEGTTFRFTLPTAGEDDAGTDGLHR